MQCIERLSHTVTQFNVMTSDSESTNFFIPPSNLAIWAPSESTPNMLKTRLVSVSFKNRAHRHMQGPPPGGEGSKLNPGLFDQRIRGPLFPKGSHPKLSVNFYPDSHIVNKIGQYANHTGPEGHDSLSCAAGTLRLWKKNWGQPMHFVLFSAETVIGPC